MKRAALLTAFAALALLVPSAARADNITDFAVFAVNNVFIPHSSIIQGWIGSNNTVNYIEGVDGSSPHTSVGSVRADGAIILDKTVTVNGDIRSNANVTFGIGPAHDVVHGSVYAPTHSGSLLTLDGAFVTVGGPFYTDVVFPALHVNPTGGANVTNGGAGGVVAPGSYGTLLNNTALAGNLSFSCGNYGFTSANSNTSVARTWTMDVSCGDIWIYFSGNVYLQDGITVNVVGGSANKVHWQTTGNWTFNGNLFFAGAVIANGTIDVGHETTLLGTAWAGNNFTGGQDFTQINIVDITQTSVTPVPEPATLGLLGLGLLAVAARARTLRARK